MESDRLSDTLKQMELFKKKLDESLLKAEVDPLKIARELGIDVSQLNPDNLKDTKEFVERLQELSEKFSKNVVNPENSKSKGVENISKKIKKQGFVSDEDQELINKMMGNYIVEEQQKIAQGCFHYDQQCCDGGIISAHSLQKKGPLYRIAEQKNNQYRVVHFKRDPKKKWKALHISIKDTSTFSGFCHHHDGIFSIIEQETYSGTDKQNFLHSYRSFAYSYHMKVEKYAYVTNIIEGVSMLEDILEFSVDKLRKLGVKLEHIPQIPKKTVINSEQEEILKVERFETYKAQLNDSLNVNKYDDLEYFTYELSHICPIICASLVNVHLEIPEGFIVKFNDQIYNGYPLLLTIFHTDRNTSIVLLARFKNDTITEQIFNDLRELTNVELENKLTSLIFEQVENFYLSPIFWNYLPQSEKEKIENDINEEKQRFPYKSSFKASINIFDRMHKLSF